MASLKAELINAHTSMAEASSQSQTSEASIRSDYFVIAHSLFAQQVRLLSVHRFLG